MFCDLPNQLIEGVQRRTHLSSSRCASVAADLPRQINERNDDGNCTDDLADCTYRFPIHGMIHVIASDIQSHCAVGRKASLGTQKRFWRHPGRGKGFTLRHIVTSIVTYACKCLIYLGNGRGGIRTHGGFPHARFRVECLKPDSATLPPQDGTSNVQRPTSKVRRKYDRENPLCEEDRGSASVNSLASRF